MKFRSNTARLRRDCLYLLDSDVELTRLLIETWMCARTARNEEIAVMRTANKLLLRGPDRVSHTPGHQEPCIEKHYSVCDLAAMWSLSENTIRRMFENEPGVLKWGTTESRYKRRYTTLRVPETVVLRVHRQFRAAG